MNIGSANDVLLNNGEPGRIPEYFSESYVPHSGGWQVGGHEVIRNALQALRTAFPDLHGEVYLLVAQDDRVAWIRTHRGTHQGAFMGVPGTGRVLTRQDIIVTQYEEDMVAMEWQVSGPAKVILSQ